MQGREDTQRGWGNAGSHPCPGGELETPGTGDRWREAGRMDGCTDGWKEKRGMGEGN